MGNIYHEWNGTVLTITSDSGTSSADLKGAKGDIGVRGAQGIAGKGSVDLTDYYTKDEVDAKIPDVSNYATMAQVEAKGYQTANDVAAAINEALGVIENGAY